MQPTSPPLLPRPSRSAMRGRSRLLIALALIPGICFGALIVLRICGLIRFFSVPTGAMTPAVSAGDHIMTEGMTFLLRQPRRGEIVVFKTDGIVSLPRPTYYVERVAGKPGDHVRISDGKLFVNDKLTSLSNAVGEIAYDPPPHYSAFSLQTDVTVPANCYFVLGDNSTNSADSRFWGSVPREN